jgi:hypothetical protein
VSIGPAHSLNINNPPEGGTLAGEPMPTSPDLYINDRGGNRVLTSASPVTAVLVRAGTDFPASAILGTRTEASVKGGVTFTNLRIAASGTNLTIRFDSPGLISATHTTPFIILPGVAGLLRIVRQPDKAQGGEPFDVQPILHVTDARGNVVVDGPGASMRVTAAIVPDSNEYNAVLAPAGSVVSAVRGVVSFMNLTINRFGFCYSLRFDADGLTTAVSAPFRVSAGPPFTMQVIRQPGSARPGYVFDSLPVVGITDVGGNVINRLSSGMLDVVSLTLFGDKYSDAGLYGTRSVTSASGISSWTDLMLKKAGTSLRLLFHRVVGGMTDVASEPFDVFPGVPQSLRVRTPPQGAAPGKILFAQPQVVCCALWVCVCVLFVSVSLWCVFVFYFVCVYAFTLPEDVVPENCLVVKQHALVLCVCVYVCVCIHSA